MEFISDHRPIRATLRITKQKKKRTGYKNNRHPTLKTDQEKINYKQNISFHLQDLYNYEEKTSVQTYYNTITKIISQSLKSARTNDVTSKDTHKVLKDRTLALIKRRQELHRTVNKTRAAKNELSALYKLISKYIKQDYKTYTSNTIEEHLKRAGSSKKAFKELRTNKRWIDGLNTEGSTVNNRKQIIDVATAFYKGLYTAQVQDTTTHSGELSSIIRKSGNITSIIEICPRFRFSEIKAVIAICAGSQISEIKAIL